VIFCVPRHRSAIYLKYVMKVSSTVLTDRYYKLCKCWNQSKLVFLSSSTNFNSLKNIIMVKFVRSLIET